MPEVVFIKLPCAKILILTLAKNCPFLRLRLVPGEDELCTKHLSPEESSSGGRLRGVGRRTFMRLKSFLSRTENGRKTKCCTLDRAGMMLEVELISNVLPHSNAVTPKTRVTTTFPATGKIRQCSGDESGPSQPSISSVIAQLLPPLRLQTTHATAFHTPHWWARPQGVKR